MKPKKEVETYSGKMLEPSDYEAAPIDTEDYASVLLEFNDGARGSFSVSQVFAGRKNRLFYELSGSKCSLVWDDTGNITVDLRPESLRAECEASLRRLRVEALDLLQIHWLDPEDDPLVEDAWATLAALKAEGKVRHIGVSNFNVGQLRRAEAIAPVETLQPPYSLVERSAEDELFPYCEQLGVGVLVYSPMQSGLLAGTFDAERVEALPETDARLFDPHFQEPLLSRNLELVERLREVARRLGATPGQVAVAWVLRHSAVDGAILGFRRPDQVDGIVVGLDRIALGEADVRELDVHELTPP